MRDFREWYEPFRVDRKTGAMLPVCEWGGVTRDACMNQNTNARAWARQTIQDADLRATASRIATLLVLRDTSVPLTHAEVVERLAEQEFDKATIFRNLTDMVAANLLRRTELGDHVWRFEIKSAEHDSHPHFVCVDCGTVSCMQDVELTRKSKTESERFGNVTEILFRGHCQDCG